MNTTETAPPGSLHPVVIPHFHVISLGAGVQSSAMALMAAAGEIQPMPAAAIFADTQDEPAAVMEWLARLAINLPFKTHRVTRGNLMADFVTAIKAGGNSRCGQPPYYIKGARDLWQEGKLRRKCTKEYKLDIIRRQARKLMKEAGANKIVQWVGISLDEAHRMKDSGAKFVANRYPLIELRMTRHDCIRWLKARGWPEPPKSACKKCPFTSDARWRQMRDQSPDEWAEAVAYDKQLRALKPQRTAAGIKGEIYIHRSCKPLDEVDLSTEEDRGQTNLFGNDCEGVCGV